MRPYAKALTLLAILFVAFALPIANIAQAAQHDDEKGKVITIAKEHKLKGVKEEKVKKGDGTVSIQAVAWYTGSAIRRITTVFGGVYADDNSFTQADCSGCVTEVVDVQGRISKNGVVQPGCSFSQMNVEIAQCDTPDVNAAGGANFRGMGSHSYRVWGGNNVFLPNTDTGNVWVQ